MLQAPDRTPYTIVAFQECERMNALCGEIKRSLGELELGLKVSNNLNNFNYSIKLMLVVDKIAFLFQGELTINADMEDLQNYIFMDAVPPTWSKLAYPSSLPMSSWFNDLLRRQAELSNWTADFNVSSQM